MQTQTERTVRFPDGREQAMAARFAEILVLAGKASYAESSESAAGPRRRRRRYQRRDMTSEE